ncbi:MAG: transglycosylase domain-containing protein [Bacillota bacterium]|nr:transglycosylase domain-containing protein [Bacillota bacterium]
MLRRILAGLVLIVLAGLAALAAYVALVPPPPPRIVRPPLLLDAYGRVMPSPAQAPAYVPFSRIPPSLVQAVVDTEDSRFWHEFGIDPVGLARAAWTDLRAGRIVEGGSTITQQLAKNLYLTPRRTLTRKLQELVLALQLARWYPRSKILEMYLNRVYLGYGARGVGAAAQLYFGKPVWRLTPAESAMIAGLIRAPELDSPYTDRQRALSRRREVLDRMVAAGHLSRRQAEQLAAEPLRLRGLGRTEATAWFDQLVREELARRYPDLAPVVEGGGYRILTTMDPALQKAAEQAVERERPGNVGKGVSGPPQAALVALDPASGAIRAAVGGAGPAGALDHLFTRRQTGSAFKPVLYAAVLESGYTLADRQMSTYVAFPGREPGQLYVPRNYAGEGEPPYQNRPLTIREAIAQSDNVVAVRWAAVEGVARIREMARRLGVTSPLGDDLTIALGSSALTPLELSQVYAALANGGRRVVPFAIRGIVGPDGRPLLDVRPEATPVVAPGVAFLLTQAMEDVIRNGTGSSLQRWVGGLPVAGKTGTTDRSVDAWFAGYSTNLVAVTWVGYDRPTPMQGVGATLAGPIWADFMQKALSLHPASDFVPPPDVERLAISAVDGLLPNPTSPVTEEWFIKGTAPRTVSPAWGSAGGRGPLPPEGKGPRPGSNPPATATTPGAKKAAGDRASRRPPAGGSWPHLHLPRLRLP